MFFKKNIILFIACFQIFSFCNAQKWTWLFKKSFNDKELQHCINNEIIIKKVGLPSFNQLIFSWNAFRPKTGYFSFYAQIRDAKTKKWHDWHHLMDWGDSMQRSFYNKTATGSINHFVRLETALDQKADSIKIKVKAHNGAQLSFLKSLAANIANFSNFKPESVNNYIFQLPTVKIVGVPRISQMVLNHPKKKAMCSPTSSSMLVNFLQKESVDPIEFAKSSYDHGLKVYGSWSFNTAHAYDLCDGKVDFFVMRLESFKTLYTLLKKNIPVVVSVRGSLIGAPKPYKNGHLLLVIGWDKSKQQVLCHDPAIYGHKNIDIGYDIRSFISAWERSKRLAYVAESHA